MHRRSPISGIVAIGSTTSCSSVKKMDALFECPFFYSLWHFYTNRVEKSRTNVRFLVDSFVMVVYTYRWEVCQ